MSTDSDTSVSLSSSLAPLSQLSDSDSSDWGVESVKSLVEKGFSTSYEGTYLRSYLDLIWEIVATENDQERRKERVKEIVEDRREKLSEDESILYSKAALIMRKHWGLLAQSLQLMNEQAQMLEEYTSAWKTAEESSAEKPMFPEERFESNHNALAKVEVRIYLMEEYMLSAGFSMEQTCTFLWRSISRNLVEQ